MSRPLVALTCYAEPASWGVWRDVPAVLVPQAYVQVLVMTGGADVDPGRYREPAHPLAQPARPDRDHTELALVRAAIEADLPLLGICRGMQVMAVAEGGRLEQHLPDRLGHATCTAPRRAGTAASECAPRKVHGCARPWANG